MKIDANALAKFEQENAGNPLTTNAVKRMLDTVLDYQGTPPFPSSYMLAAETLMDMKILIQFPELTPVTQINS